jgi:predicted naringenin-chalcone synthase
MMVDERSYGLENSKDKMSWEASSTGFQMQLSYKVPVLLARSIKPFVDALLKEWTEVSMCDWAIHPGGKSILQVIERDLALDREQTTASWETFADYGNMSSATFLFVLRKLHQLSSKRIWTAGLGFGPGLSMEGVLLRKYPSERTL